MRDYDKTEKEEWYAVRFLIKKTAKVSCWLHCGNEWQIRNRKGKKAKWDTHGRKDYHHKFKERSKASAALRTKKITDSMARYGYVSEIVKITRIKRTVQTVEIDVVVSKGISPLVLLARAADG